MTFRGTSLMTIALCAATAAFLAAVPVSAIQCYACENCGDDPLSAARSTKVNCARACAKVKLTQTTAGGPITNITRGCFPVSIKKEGCIIEDGTDIIGFAKTSCLCASELCNSATSGCSPAILFAILSTAVALLGV